MLDFQTNDGEGAAPAAPVLPPSVINANASMYDKFFQTAYERMAIYHRRFIEKRRAPWTTDAILSEFSFTNVHRELDRGTIVYADDVLAPLMRSGTSDGDILAATIAYRWFNRVATWEQSLAGPILGGHFDVAEIEQLLRAQSGPPFTAAHMTCAYHGKPGRDKIERVCLMLGEAFAKRDVVAVNLKAAQSPQRAFDVIGSLNGIGPGFLAYEIYSDLIYAGDRFFSWGEDAWANVGPGAHRGLKLIFPNAPPSAHYGLLTRLRDDQAKAFDRLELDFYALSPNGKRLTMRSVEHWACEFQKYARGNTKRKFAPMTAINTNEAMAA